MNQNEKKKSRDAKRVNTSRIVNQNQYLSGGVYSFMAGPSPP
jgi:hypothetical protein